MKFVVIKHTSEFVGTITCYFKICNSECNSSFNTAQMRLTQSSLENTSFQLLLLIQCDQMLSVLWLNMSVDIEFFFFTTQITPKFSNVSFCSLPSVVRLMFHQTFQHLVMVAFLIHNSELVNFVFGVSFEVLTAVVTKHSILWDVSQFHQTTGCYTAEDRTLCF